MGAASSLSARGPSSIHEAEYQQYRKVQVTKRMLSLPYLEPEARQFWEEQLQQAEASLIQPV
jgi:hypothetical protein